ncbi:carbohydrate binding domain-containing protein [Paenibacillus phytohabitans]|uniref:carbohydrate binding domain-containing protein n=1 Tax=Paenibacillus phytohabitans TaxID=2654978 RepID=UPI001491CE02|nr:carbohydrate binding domain-containing protein [Paenibacillus phytohabitans]
MQRRAIAILLIAQLIVSILPGTPVSMAAPAEPQQTSAAAYPDVIQHWAGDAAGRLSADGILKGYADGLFHPQAPVTRAELVMMLNRVFQYTAQGTISFVDVSDSAWYAEPVMKAYQAGVVNGTGGDRFMPDAKVQRQDGFVMLSRAFQLEASAAQELTAFSDNGQVASYASSAVASMVAAGYVSGDLDKRLNPRAPLTRGEAAVILDHMIGWISPAAGEYTPGEVKSNAVVNRTGAVLQGSSIAGSLYVTEGVGEGEFRASRVNVTGRVLIRGGGVNSVVFEQSELGAVVVDKSGAPVRLALNGDTAAESISVRQKSMIEVSAGSKVGQITIGPKATGSSIVNHGTITLLEVEADGVLLNGQPVAKGSKLERPGSVAATPTATSTPAPASTVTVNTGSGSSTATPASTPSPAASVAPTAVPTSTPTATPQRPVEPADAWELVWNDEFDGEAIDTAKWNVQDTGLVYNNELEYYRPENAGLQEDEGNQVLVLEAKNESHQGKNYTSGKLTSKLKGDWTYGKFTVRAKLPVQQGMWPAIWMMPTDELEQYGPWPGSGEMDIMELTGPVASDPDNAGKYPRTVHGSLHYDSPHLSQTDEYLLPEGQTFADGYHEFTMEWLPGLIRYYVDGEKYFETRDWGTKAEGQQDYYTFPAPFDRPFYMILNLAVGGDWPGNPLDSFQSDKMYVDYVRVYKYTDMANWPDVTGKRGEGLPPVTAQRPPLPDGNQIYNGDFNGTVNSSGLPENWDFILNTGGQGEASVVNDPDKGAVAKVAVTQPGTQNYALQLTQMPLLLENGKAYKVTFDAKADAARPFMTKLTEFGGGWTAYSKERTFQLTEEWQTYEYTFNMGNSSDNNVRFEFNLGLDTTAAYFTNVKVVETEPLPVIREPLPDGNLIFNSGFDLGEDRMKYWTYEVAAGSGAGAAARVTNELVFPIMDRKLVSSVQVPGADAGSVKLSQSGLPLTPGTAYELSFDGKADRNLPVQIGLEAGDSSVNYAAGTAVVLTEEKKHYSKIIELGADAGAEGNLSFLLGESAGLAELDNVRLTPKKNPPVISGYLHFQADSYWNTEGTSLIAGGEGTKDITSVDEGDYTDYKLRVAAGGTFVPVARVASVEEDSEVVIEVLDQSMQAVAEPFRVAIGNTGGLQSYQPINSAALTLPAGTYYLRISGQGYNLAWLDLSREMVAGGSFDSKSMEGWTLFKKDWDDSDPVKDTVAYAVYGNLEVKLGGTGDESWNAQLNLRGLTLEKGKTYQLSFDARASLDRSILALIQHDGNADGNWSAAYLEQAAVLGGEDTRYTYMFIAGADEPSAILQFSLGKIDQVLGEHTVTLDNISLIRVHPALAGGPVQENMMANGDFASGTAGWNLYSTDSGELSIANVEEALQIHVGTVGSNSWDRQVFYEGLALEQGNRYTLTFKAKAEAARLMNISIGWLDAANNYTWHGYTSAIVDLTNGDKLYTIVFDVNEASTEIGRISLELGNIAGGAAGNLNVQIDDILLVKSGEIPAE